MEVIQILVNRTLQSIDPEVSVRTKSRYVAMIKISLSLSLQDESWIRDIEQVKLAYANGLEQHSS